MATPATATLPTPKPNGVRKQVSRACEWCRTRRVKCDLSRPCRACEKSGAACIDERTDNPRSLPQAMREIERLKERIRHLETERAEDESAPNVASSLDISPITAVIPTHRLEHPIKTREIGRWEGIFLATARSEHTTSFFGPSSMQYFLSRVGAFVANTFEDPVPTRNILLTGAHRRLAHPTSRETSKPGERTVTPLVQPANIPSTPPAMTRMQEEYFLNTFWESIYCTFPIIDEDAFRVHYDSLWERNTNNTGRMDSALVDMVLALCIQSSSAFLPQAVATAALASGEDPTIAGRWHYRRGRALITADMESPSTTTVQVLLLAVVYLCCASFQNTAHATLALAVRDASIVGLHREPPTDLSDSERELRKRLWWTLWTVDTKMCLKLGRPFDVDMACDSFVSFPSDTLEIASRSVLHDTTWARGKVGDVTWLTYGTHIRAIVSTTGNIHRAVFPCYDQILASHNPPLSSPYRHPDILEKCAQVLSSHVAPLHALAEQIPKALRLPREHKSGYDAFSFDGRNVRLDENIPVWLQSQRLYLEMTYHSMAIGLYRPFISFSHRGAGSSALHRYMPAADRHAARAARHAITFVHIVHKAVRDTTLLAPCWNEYFHWLWNAAVTLIGFLFAHPLHSTTTAAREAADCAVAVCDTYAASRFTVAADASSILRCFLKRVDELFARVAGVLGGPEAVSNSTTPTAVASISDDAFFVEAQGDADTVTGMPSSDMALEDPAFLWLEPQEPGNNTEGLNMFMDWALTVDSFNSFEQLLEPSTEWDASRW